MLMADPTVLRTLVERYEALRAQADRTGAGSSADAAAGPDPRVEQRLRDTAYTLCVSTGTREIGAALAAARSRIDAAADGRTLGESAA